MPAATVEGVTLYYERHGARGDDLVLVHGLTGDVSDWRYQVQDFSPSHRVLVMDLRGHGRSQAPSNRASYTIPRMASDVSALLDALDVERFHLAGHSMGGAIAQEMALAMPERLLSLTLLDTSYRFGQDSDTRQRLEERRLMAEAGGMAAIAEADAKVDHPAYLPESRVEEQLERLRRMSVDGFVGALQALGAWEGFESRASSIRTPALVMFGGLDSPSLQAGCARLAELITEATLEVIPEAGHAPQEERPELFNAALRSHLERHALT